MTFVYINPLNDFPRKYGPTIIALTDSQVTYKNDLTKDNAQKLTQHNLIVSLGTGQGGTIFEQNKRIKSLDETVDFDFITKEFFPEMCKYHLQINGLPNLLNPELDPNSLPDNVKEKIWASKTETYLVKKIDEQYKIFEFKLSGDTDRMRDGSHFFHRPSVSIWEQNNPIIGGSGTTSVMLGSYVSKTLGNNPPEFIKSIRYSNETGLYLPMLSALDTADTASRSPGVNNHFQIGVLNNFGYNTIFDKIVSMDDDDEALAYVNSVLSTSIPNKDSVIQHKLTGQRLTHSIANKFFDGFFKFDKSRTQLLSLRNNKDYDVSPIPNLEKDLEFIENEHFIPDRNSFYRSIKCLMSGEIYKILPPNSREGKQIRELQKIFPKK